MNQTENIKERSHAFWKFFLFYVISIVAIVLAVFFNLLVEKKQISDAKKNKLEYQKHVKAEDEFVAAIEEVKNLLDSLSPDYSEIMNFTSLRESIGIKISHLEQLQEKDKSTANKSDKILFEIINKYFIAKNDFVITKSDLDKCQNHK